MDALDRIVIAPDEIAEKEFYAAIEEGLKDIEEGRTYTSQEVRQAMHDEIDRVFDMKKR